MSLDVSEIQCACLSFCLVEERSQPPSTAWPDEAAPNASKLTYSLKIILSRHWNSNSKRNYSRIVLDNGSTTDGAITCFWTTKANPILSHPSLSDRPTNAVGANAAATITDPQEVRTERVNNGKASSRINERICRERWNDVRGRESWHVWSEWFNDVQVLQHLNLA